jgi:hypothetical protein
MLQFSANPRSVALPRNEVIGSPALCTDEEPDTFADAEQDSDIDSDTESDCKGA